MTTKDSLPIPILVLRLRTLVLALGESTTPAWWNTDFMGETGLRFLERLFPRTAQRAAIHAAGKAASEVHDCAVGRIGVYHLFKLPESLETEVERLPNNSDEEFFLAIRTAFGCQDKLLEMLAALCEVPAPINISSGPKWIKTDKGLLTPEAFEKTAGIYLQAFTQNKPAFPYFLTEQVGDVINNGKH